MPSVVRLRKRLIASNGGLRMTINQNLRVDDEFIERVKTPAWICRATGAPLDTPTLCGPGVGPLVLEPKARHRIAAIPSDPCRCTLAQVALDHPRRAAGVSPVFAEQFCLFPTILDGELVFIKRDIRHATRRIMDALDRDGDGTAPKTVILLPFVYSRTRKGQDEGRGRGKPHSKGHTSVPYSAPRMKALKELADQNS